MARSHTVTLKLGALGTEVTAWDEVTIGLDMLSAGNPWTLTLWREGRAETWATVRDLARIYAPVELTIDGALQTRGIVERIREGASRAGAPLTLSGRDALASALVADVDPRLSLRGATLEEVATRAVAPLGVTVTIGASAEEARRVQAGARPGARSAGGARTTRRRHRVDQFKPRPGERVWQFLEALTRRHGFLMYVAPAGEGVGLVIDRPAYDAPVEYQLTRRRGADGTWTGNILEGWRDINATEVPTEVTTFGHARLAGPADARHAATVLNTGLAHPRVVDVYLPRPRYLRDPRARTPQIAEQRARVAIARSMAGFEVYEATVQGFAQESRRWAINAMVHIDDELTGVRGDWLTTAVTFTRSRAGGHITRLRLVPKNAVLVEPDPEA